ncbi:hypothetical protein IPP75_03730 [Candidatus Saccharibacteria bacterium]|nr:MAG: hypothetical protein IPP75_03730 [Candidatus Saccharibacteria bacterium]
MFGKRKKTEKTEWLGCSSEMYVILWGHPQIPSADIQTKPHAFDVQKRISVPLRKIWAMAGMASFTDDSVKALPSGEKVASLEYANRLRGTTATVYNQDDPIILTPFSDANGNVGYKVAEGRHRVLAAIGGGNMTHIEVDVRIPQNSSEMDFYPGVIVDEQAVVLQGGNQ